MERVYNFLSNHLNKRKYFYIVLFSVFAVYVIPFLFVQLPKGHDIYFHMTRIEGLAKELEIGNFPARIYSSVYYDYGYAAPLLYGDWLLHIPALLVLAGMNLVCAYKTFILLCSVLAALSMYFSAQVILKDKKSSCVAALLYVFSTYFATDAYIRHANGEFQSFIFIPIAFAGLYNIVAEDGIDFKNNRKWMLLPLGLCGVLVTHTITAAMTMVFFTIFTLLFIVKLIKQPKRLIYLVASIGVFFLLSASFILPMVEQMTSSKFLATDGFSADYFGTLAERAMPNIFSLFSVNNTHIEGTEHFIPQGVGPTLLFLIGWRLFYFKKTNSYKINVLFALAVFALLLTSRFFPWEYLQDICGTIQFPWRIFIFSSLFIALFGAMLVCKLKNVSPFSNTILIIAIIAISLTSAICTLYPRYKTVYNAEKDNVVIEYPYPNNIGLGEYLPSGTSRAELRNNKRNIQSNADFAYCSLEKTDGIFIMKYKGKTQKDAYVDIPIVNYKGYKAVLETDNGQKELPIDYGYNNLIRLNFTEESGTVRVWYDGTAIQKYSFFVSCLSFFGIGFYYLIVCFKRIKKNTLTTEIKVV